MKHTKHLWRAAILLVFALSAIVVGRHFVVPASFGEMGFYRGDALYEFMDKAPEHSGTAACAECHDDIADEKAAGAHASVECEVCHHTAASHIRDDDKFADMAIDRSWKLCAHCHRYLVARPATMPQINLAEHLELAPGEAVPDEACLDCHDDVHSP
jgi:hypothetical protein